MRGFLGMLAALVATGTMAADTGEDRSLSLTIYNKDLALIEHVRPVDLPAGQQRVEFSGVSAGIIPETVSFGASSLDLIEQNFDFDLLTPAKLMQKAVGSRVTLVRTNPATGAETRESADVLSATGGVVLRIGNRIEVLRDDNLPTRVIFDKVPENLRANPTLSVLVKAAQPVNEDVRLAYLSHGLSWNADYVAVFDERKKEAALQGWITLKNESGTSFRNAQVQLVAGDLNVQSDSAWATRESERRNQLAAGKQPARAAPVGDYYLYPLAHPTTIADRQTKQVSFVDAQHVAAAKAYEITFDGFYSREPQSADVRVRFANSHEAGLGTELPAGVVRVYARDSRGAPQFIGEDHIDHSSAGSEFALRIGEAFDVSVQATKVKETEISKRVTEHEMSYLVRNARAAPVVLTLRMTELARGNEIRAESIHGRRVDASSLAWDIPVAANGETTFTCTIRE
jgi:hypothetical protein